MSKNIRPIRVEGNIAYVPLTQGYEAIIDAASVPVVSKWNWYAKIKAHTVYAVRQSYQNGKQRTVGMHTVILPPTDGLVPDHKNGNGLDNRISNLRCADNFQNGYNTKISSRNTSGYKGVHWVETHKKWRAMIRVKSKRIFLGYFCCPKEAASAYAKASKKYHGEFSRLA